MNNPTLSFEDAMKRLEEIVLYLERGNIPLEEAVQAYEEGMQLKKICLEKLEHAQLRIEKVTGAPKKEPETVE
jgi:exodeoxyribonuclease VII small subunit